MYDDLMLVIVHLGFVGRMLMIMGAVFSSMIMVMDLFRTGMRMLVGMFMGMKMFVFGFGWIYRELYPDLSQTSMFF